MSDDGLIPLESHPPLHSRMPICSKDAATDREVRCSGTGVSDCDCLATHEREMWGGGHWRPVCPVHAEYYHRNLGCAIREMLLDNFASNGSLPYMKNPDTISFYWWREDSQKMWELSEVVSLSPFKARFMNGAQMGTPWGEWSPAMSNFIIPGATTASVPGEIRRPKVGIGVLILDHGQVLLGKRLNSHGAGEWSLPGGHLEWMEEFDQCCAREVLEETGLAINNIKPNTFDNNLFWEEEKHYVTLFFTAHAHGGVLANREPLKCEGWRWFPLRKLPEPLFGQIYHAVDALPPCLKPDVIDSFRGRHSFLSNFYHHTITYKGIQFRSTETAYQMEKIYGPDLDGQTDDVKNLFATVSSTESKAMGKNKAKADWRERSLQVMLDVLRIKFSQSPMRNLLLDTGDSVLVEGNNWHDDFYGTCSCGNCPPGANWLGRLLMRVRDELNNSQTVGVSYPGWPENLK